MRFPCILRQNNWAARAVEIVLDPVQRANYNAYSIMKLMLVGSL